MGFHTPTNKTIITKSPHMEVDDLLIEIFLRLPLHSIQRFITVCKNWQSLITNTTLPKLWRKRNLKPPTGIFYCTKVSYYSKNFFIPFPSFRRTTVPCLTSTFKIIQSCNGLFLCLTKTTLTTEFHVYNPTNDTCHTLPKLGKGGSMSLAFDPKRSSHYKVICRYLSDPKNYDVYIYSSDTFCWSKAGSMPFSRGGSYRGVYWNGAIHWMSQWSCFDIENHSCKKMPEPADNGWINRYFDVSCDRVNYAEVRKSESGQSCRVDVYELKRDYSEWVLKHHVELEYSPYTIVLSVVHGEEEDDSFLVLDTTKGIVAYHLVSKTSEELSISMEGKRFDRACQYIESHYRVC